MELNEYQKKAITTSTEKSDNATYMLFGLMAEVGEIADKVAKWKRKGEAYFTDDRLVFTTSDQDEARALMTELAKEIGDVQWFVAGLARIFGFTLENVAQMNLDKLASRKDRGVIVGNGDNR